jgi:predicted  nucleic acid-binding Zn-ribbon protein
LVNDINQNTSSMQASKTKLEKALARLERAVDDKVTSVDKLKKIDTELIAAHKRITELREKNKVASERLDSTINQIRKILGS